MLALVVTTLMLDVIMLFLKCKKAAETNQVTGRHDAKAKADAEDTASVRKSELSSRQHEKEQKAEDEEALAAHYLSNHGQKELIALTPRRQQSSQPATAEMHATQRKEMVLNHFKPGNGSMDDWNISWITRKTTTAPAT